MALVDEIKSQESGNGQSTVLQRPSLLIQHISEHGWKGLNQEYVDTALTNGLGFGATAAGVKKDSSGKLNLLYNYTRRNNESKKAESEASPTPVPGSVQAQNLEFLSQYQQENSLLSRLKKTGQAAVSGIKDAVASNTDAQRALYEAGQNMRDEQTQSQIEELEYSLAEAQRAYDQLVDEVSKGSRDFTQKDVDDKAAQIKLIQDQIAVFKKVPEAQRGATEETSKIADEVKKSADEDIARIKKNSGKFGRFAIDIVAGATQMAADRATGALLGTNAMPALVARAFGGATQQARQGGGTIGQQLAYGSAVATVEAITEKIADGLAGAYGTGEADEIAEEVIRRLAKSPAGQTALRTLYGMGSEFAEEFISDAVNPTLRSIYNGKTIGQNYSEESVKDWLYDGLIGAATSLVSGTPERIVRGQDARANAQNEAVSAIYGQMNENPSVKQAVQDRGILENIKGGKDYGNLSTAEQASEAMEALRGRTPDSVRAGQLAGARNRLFEIQQQRAAEAQAARQNAAPPAHPAAAQEPTTRNPLYEAIRPRTEAVAESATASQTPENAPQTQEAPTGEITPPAVQNAQSEAGAQPQTAETAQTRLERVQARYAELESAFDNGEVSEADADDLSREMEQLYSEIQELTPQAELERQSAADAQTQQQRVEAGEVSKDYGTPENHIDRRTPESVGNTGMKSFQFDNPQLHGYYVEAAQALFDEVQNAEDADYGRKVNPNTRYERGSAITGPIRRLMDMGLTKPQIVKCLQDIIADNGQENYAAAKRVELVLNDMLTNGWQGQRGRNDWHEANADYIAAKDAIDGGIKADSWERFLAQNELSLIDGTVTEDQLRQEWEQMHPQEEAAAEEAETAPEASQHVETESAGTEQSAGTIPASEQTTAERTNGQGPERERNMSRNLRGNEKAEQELRNSFEQNRDLYTQLTNAEVAAKAAEIVGKGYDAAKNDIYEKIGQAKAGAKLAPEYAVAGYQLANEMVRRGETEAARELCADIAAELTYAGQVGQIGRLILESDPSIRIKTVDKIVDKINDSMTDRQKAKNKKRSNGKESVRKANEAAQAAQKQAADMVANALSGGETFNFPDAAAKEVAGSIKAQIKRALSPQKPRNALDTFVGYVKKFAREKINVGEKSRPMTSTELLREVVNNEELFMEVYEKAQAEFMGEDATGYREFVEDYVNTPVGIDGTGDARNKLFMQAIVESATATSENAKTIRTQAALGVPHGEIANRIADTLIQETGATGGIADSIRGSAQAYVNEIINSDEKTGDSRAKSEVTAIMQAIGVKFREMAVQNKAAKDAVRRDIANMLATEYALSPDSAEKIAQSVANEYDRQLSDAMAKEVEKRFAPKEKRAKAEAKALTRQLTEAINLGTFSSDYAAEAVNKIFGVDGNISVSDEALQRYAAAETKEEQNAALDAIEQEIADQIPATFRDKFTALRYLNMLGNLKTQGRNIVGNAAMMTATNVKYLTQHVGELAASLATGGKYEVNTALNTSKELRQQAAADFEANIDEIKGDAKYADVGRQAAKDIKDKQQIFGTTGNALWDNTVGRGLEGARKATKWAMEVGDEIFLRQVYIRSFAGWMKAHGVADVNSASAEQVSSAREFAKKEAQEATFHDSNKVSDWVSSLGRGQNTPQVVKMISEGIVPFRKTPANVAVRAIEYSPVGAIGTIYEAVQAKKGNASAADVINSAAKNLTGTALFGIGMLMAAAGRARASGDDEDKKLNEFKKLQGETDYSVKVGGKYISLSQLAPMAIPFFMGVKLNELLEYSDNLFSADSIGDILGVVSEPMLEMSMLSGVNDFLNDLSSLNGDTDALPSLVGNAALSYLSQGLTNSLLGQLEQASERTRQTTYSDTKSKDATSFDRFLGKNQYKIGKYSAKIPGIDYNQQDYVDAWGRTQSNGGAGERAFNAFLNPTYTGKDRSTDVDEELERLYRENKDKADFPNVFPQKRSRSDAIGDGVVMTPDEYLAFSQESGQKKLELVREFMQSGDYKNLTDEQRAETIHNLYAFADAAALQKVRDANGVTVKNKYAKISDLSDVPSYLAATERFKAEAAKEGKEFNGWTNTNFEKYVSAGLKAEDLDVLAESALSDTRKPAYDLMRVVGMSPKEYMDAIAEMDGEKHDGQFKQADVYSWLAKNNTMSTEQKNQLWDMLGNNWKTSYADYAAKNGGDESKATKSSGNALYDYYKERAKAQK